MVLDGAMGTTIQQYQLEEADFRNNKLANHEKPLQGNNDLLSLTRPDIVYDIFSQHPSPLFTFLVGRDIIRRPPTSRRADPKNH